MAKVSPYLELPLRSLAEVEAARQRRLKTAALRATDGEKPSPPPPTIRPGPAKPGAPKT